MLCYPLYSVVHDGLLEAWAGDTYIHTYRWGSLGRFSAAARANRQPRVVAKEARREGGREPWRSVRSLIMPDVVVMSSSMQKMRVRTSTRGIILC